MFSAHPDRNKYSNSQAPRNPKEFQWPAGVPRPVRTLVAEKQGYRIEEIKFPAGARHWEVFTPQGSVWQFPTLGEAQEFMQDRIAKGNPSPGLPRFSVASSGYNTFTIVPLGKVDPDALQGLAGHIKSQTHYSVNIVQAKSGAYLQIEGVGIRFKTPGIDRESTRRLLRAVIEKYRQELAFGHLKKNSTSLAAKEMQEFMSEKFSVNPKSLGAIDWDPKLKVWRVIWYEGPRDVHVPKGDFATQEEAMAYLMKLVDERRKFKPRKNPLLTGLATGVGLGLGYAVVSKVLKNPDMEKGKGQTLHYEDIYRFLDEVDRYISKTGGSPYWGFTGPVASSLLAQQYRATVKSLPTPVQRGRKRVSQEQVKKVLSNLERLHELLELAYQGEPETSSLGHNPKRSSAPALTTGARIGLAHAKGNPYYPVGADMDTGRCPRHGIKLMFPRGATRVYCPMGHYLTPIGEKR